jgi:hypothetical protein
MDGACVACTRPVRDRRFGGAHWLCRAHRKRHATRALDTRTLTYAALLLRLVFTFPDDATPREFAARVMHVADVWGGVVGRRTILDMYGLKGKVRLTELAVASRRDALSLLEPFVAFVLRLGTAEVAASCASVVRACYPCLIEPTCVRRMLSAERLLYHTRRHAESGGFLVMADLAVAMPRLDARVIETIYLAYARAICRGSETVALKLKPPT